MSGRVLLFINGVPPVSFPSPENYALIACTDGAFHYLKEKGFPLDRLDFISGDFDSHVGSDDEVYDGKFICTPDQNKTDFHKALEIIIRKGFTTIDVYGASGGEQDHFLGNLSVAFKFKDQVDLKFYDEFSEYYFISSPFTVKGVQQKMISLYPFPFASHITSKGLHWPLKDDFLSITDRLGTRNYALEDEVSIVYEEGCLLLFIGQKYL